MNACESDRVPVPGSDRVSLAGARPVAPVDPEEQLHVTVLVRRREGAVPPEPAAPATTAVSVDHAQNNFGNPAQNPKILAADAEVALDIEVAGAIAAGSSIAVYFAPDTDQGFIDAITTASRARAAIRERSAR